jgi:predicted secreted acid phosphatase
MLCLYSDFWLIILRQVFSSTLEEINDPLYRQCLTEFGIVKVTQTIDDLNPNRGSANSNDLHMHQIQCPAKIEVRYRKLNEITQWLISIGSNVNDHIDRVTKNGLASQTKFVEKLRRGGKGVVAELNSLKQGTYGLLAPNRVGSQHEDEIQMR